MDMNDKYLMWLVERKEKIRKMEDDDMKKSIEMLHDNYAEEYIAKKSEGKFISKEQFEKLKEALNIVEQSGFPNKLSPVVKEIIGDKK